VCPLKLASQILKALTRKLDLAGELDLTRLAAMTSGFSGADLQSLVSNAQLEAIHDILDSPIEIDEDASKHSSGLLPSHLRLWRDKEKGMNSSQKTDLLKQVRGRESSASR
jgi:SpoVK/Ycf46/Vps4 family AAA+-type ATPase